MSVDIWAAACEDGEPHTRLDGVLFRLVESQVQIATHRLVSSLEEQAVLEELLDKVKPPLPRDAGNLHYLLATPFRYPPLRYGSRFGRRHEPSLFYGSLTVAAVLAETAYYRFLFWHGMETAPESPLNTQHTLFSAHYACDRGIKLHQPPFDVWQADLAHRSSYVATQPLGSSMRAAGIEAFEFVSARDPASGINVALFRPSALASQRPETTQNWWAETCADHADFYCHEASSVYRFDLSTFLVEGALPLPAL